MVNRLHLRGGVDPLTLILIVGIGLGGVTLAGWKPFAFLKRIGLPI